jgi:hypothetical protein
MNAQFSIADSHSINFAPFRVVTKIFGGLLGPEFIVCADDKYFRVGELTVGQLKRGIPAEDLDMLEVDPETYEAI